MSVIKLAIVDDHKLFRQGLRHILSRSGQYEVSIEAASGQEFLTALEAGQPDVVLLDLHLPDLDGRAVSRAVLDRYPAVRIIILSMNYSDEFILEMMRLGVHGYLPKDIDQKILVEAITQVQTQGYYLDATTAQVMRAGLQAPAPKAPARRKVSSVALLVPLTEREREVLTLICKGLSSQQIADQLFISFRTVEGHRKNLLDKTGMSNAVSLALFAVRHQLVESVD
ncbi:response regulator [Hymenobacter persicinus]|uniref:Response regulator transcription factor n=1 Tax=Hymenobacter persicinus TaxID=2025506 RepID=A0A4Q5L7D4_9BACT|nr:response regulator transcription factor [Hymenobacter persicinus]RYU76726.1 response regulator transcription factor [Hymenobacter persicinus]